MEIQRELTGDEMFEELGYKKSKNNISGNVFYTNKYKDTIIYDVSDCTIIFTRSMCFDMQELKAINKKCEELRVVIMVLNKCINCCYWITCNKADPEVKNCEYFRKSEVKEIKRYENND